MRIVTTLLALVTISGVAAAQNAPCPECDDDGPDNLENSYSSVDLGYVGNGSEALADTDLATSHLNDDKGFWAWLGICLSAWLEKVGHAIGVQTDVDASAEVYASEDGVDLDANVHGVQRVCAVADETLSCDLDFDRSDVGDLDGMTWEVMQDVNAQRDALGLQTPVLPGEGLDAPSADLDLCLHAELEVVACG